MQGDAGARYNLGNCYYYGSGVEKNLTEAVSWCYKAAAQGRTDAQNALDEIWDREKVGVAQKELAASNWEVDAKEKNDAWAQCNLGKCYLYGKGVAQDLKKGYGLLPMRSGLKEYQYTCAKCYLYGWGTGQSKFLAKDYLEKVGDYKDAKKLLEQL